MIRNGIRQWNGIGVTNIRSKRFHQQNPGEFTQRYNQYLAPLPAARFANDVYRVIRMRFQWYTFYGSSTSKPSLANHRDPNWSNYRWNGAGSNPNATYTDDGETFLHDPIAEALNTSLVNNGNGIVKIQVHLDISASGGQFAPPIWMRANPYGWLDETGGANGTPGEYHINFQNAETRDHLEAFMEAFLAKYGNNKGIHSILLGEHFMDSSPWATGVTNRTDYYTASASMWPRIRNVAPVDSDGAKINIIQTNPVLDVGTLGVSSLRAGKIGISSADVELGFSPQPPELVPLIEAGQDGVTPVAVNNDGRNSTANNGAGNSKSWNGAPNNPFGLGNGDSAVPTPSHLAWNHGDKGTVPVHTFMMNIVSGNQHQNQTTFEAAINRFGQGGTDAAQWGPVPRLLKVPSSTTGEPGFNGSLEPGVQLIANIGTLTNVASIQGYDWVWSDPARSWTGPTYQLNGDHVGKTFYLRARGTDTQGDTFVKQTGTFGPIEESQGTPNYNPVGSVFLTGNAVVGGTLAPSHNITDQNGRAGAIDVYTYFWDNGFAIGSGESYTAVDEDRGVRIRARLQYTDDDDYPNTVYSPYVFISAAGGGTAATAHISASGNVLSVVSTITDADGALSYEWHRGQSPIPNAKKSSYQWVLADVGFDIYCYIRYLGTDGNQKVVVSQAYGPIRSPLRGSEIMLDEKDWDVDADQNTFLPPDGAGEFQIKYREVNDVIREIQAVRARSLADNDGSLAMTGPANVYAVNLHATSYDDISKVRMFKASVPVSNTSATVTVNPNNIGALPVVKQNLNPLSPGDLAAGGVYEFVLKSDNSAYLANISGAVALTSQEIKRTKTADSQITGQSPANDPHLNDYALVAGTYEVDGFLVFDAPSGQSGFNFSLSGQNVSGYLNYTYNDFTGATFGRTFNSSIGPAVTLPDKTTRGMNISGLLIATASTTISLQTSRTAADPTNELTFLAGSKLDLIYRP